MCGIAGYVQRGSEPRVIEAMLDRIAHRGPDGSGAMELAGGEWRAMLGHRRLAIIDLVTGDQPMKSADREDVAIVFNGEIYNFENLRREQELAGR
ncbi:MAG TPA: asparagine synthetase B, partial [Polyangiaceae bacterium]